MTTMYVHTCTLNSNTKKQRQTNKYPPRNNNNNNSNNRPDKNLKIKYPLGMIKQSLLHLDFFSGTPFPLFGTLFYVCIILVKGSWFQLGQRSKKIK